MERRHGGEDIGVAPVEALEDGDAQHLVEAAQSGSVARRAEDGLEAVVHHVPGRGGGMDVVSGEADEVDQEEHHGEAQVGVALALEVEVDAEGYRHGHPAEVEDACQEVGHGPMVTGEVLAGCQRARRWG